MILHRRGKIEDQGGKGGDCINNLRRARFARFYLCGIVFGVDDGRSDVAVSLANDGRIPAATDGVTFPVRVVVVDYVEEPPAAPRHPLFQSLPKMVEGKGDLHLLVLGVIIP